MAKKVLKIKDQPYSYTPKISTEAEKDRFIKSVEKLVRGSMEYKQDLIPYLRKHCDMDRCAILNKIQKLVEKVTGKHGKISIEIHHEPFTLYDIVHVVLNKYIQEGEPVNALLIANEVLELHYSNMVGLIPLSKTLHKTYHKNPKKIPLPLNLVCGEYSKFLDKYEEYIIDPDAPPNTKTLYDKLEEKIKITENLSEEDFDAILTEFLYLEVEGVEDPEPIPVAEVIAS